MIKIAVLGLGQSVNSFSSKDYDCVIGVNDIWKIYPAEAVVCLDKRSAFTADRLKTIDQCKPKYFYSQIVIWDTRPDFRKIDFFPGYPDQFVRIDESRYEKSYCSPFVAVQIAFKEFHADEIHIFGVDLVNHPHLDAALCGKIKKHFKNLRDALTFKNVEMVVHGNGILTTLL